MGCVQNKNNDDRENKSEKRAVYHDQETVDLSKLTITLPKTNGK